jgi:hypothetical protein
MFVHPDHNNRAVSFSFVKKLPADGWVITDTIVLYPDYGNSVISSCWPIVAVHFNTKPSCAALALQPPSQVPSWPLARFVWAPFYWPKLAFLYSKDDPSFNLHAFNDNRLPSLRALPTTESQCNSFSHNVKVIYNLHRKQDYPAVLVSFAVIDTDELCPAFNPNVNSNLFGNYFGMRFILDGHTYIRAIKPFIFVLCFRLTDKLTYQLYQHCNSFCMDAAIQYHWLRSLRKFLSVASMSVLVILRFASPINLPHWQHASRLFLMVLLVCGCHLARFG